MTELDALDPVPEQIKLQSGAVIQLEPLRTRQFFKLLRIITHGALPGMRDAGLFSMDGMDQGEFTAQLLSLLVLSIPDAEDETIDFVRSMCKPIGLIERRDLNKQDRERNLVLWASLDEQLENPELDDLISIIEAIVRREAADIQALGKRLMSMFKVAEKTGQLAPRPQSASTPTSSAVSADTSTSSPASTDGTTSASATSPSDGSDSASPQFASVSTTPVGSGING